MMNQVGREAGADNKAKEPSKAAKIAAIAVGTVVGIAVMLMWLCGCSSSEQVVRNGVAEQLDHYKNADEAAIEECEEAIPPTQAEALGIDREAFTRSLLEGFDYTIDEVTVDGDNATAVVTVTCKKLGGLQDEGARLAEKIKEDPSIAGSSSDEAYQWIGSKLTEYVSNAPLETREPITFEFTKSGNTWRPTASANRAMSNLFVF